MTIYLYTHSFNKSYSIMLSYFSAFFWRITNLCLYIIVSLWLMITNSLSYFALNFILISSLLTHSSSLESVLRSVATIDSSRRLWLDGIVVFIDWPVSLILCISMKLELMLIPLSSTILAETYLVALYYNINYNTTFCIDTT